MSNPEEPGSVPELSNAFEWDGVVATSTTGGGFAYVPNRALVPSDLSIELGAFAAENEEIFAESGPIEGWVTVMGKFDVVRLVGHLRSLGVRAQPVHVFFAHGELDCCCGDHPFDLLSQPLRSNPLRSNPLRSNPLRSNPLRSNPLRSNSVDAELPTKSSARPVAAPTGKKPVNLSGVETRVTVIDTGLAGSIDGVQLCPPLIASAKGSAGLSIRGALDSPDVERDGWLDAVAGHGTFIAGLIQQHAPGCQILIHKAVRSKGQVDEAKVAQLLIAEASKPVKNRAAFINLSFGGSIWESASMLESAIYTAQQAGIVVVASAGNEGVCTPTYPAAFPAVIGVGSIGPDGPSWFSNYGPWVNASAPGEDLVSSFFANWDGKNPQISGNDVDDFRGWAVWSGTSFAAPMVVAALVREMRLNDCSNTEAVARLIHAPHLARIPGMGTIVNI